MFDVEIEPGDFIRSKLIGVVCGIVSEPATLTFGRLGAVPGYVVHLWDGRRDFIAAEDAELVAMSEDHLCRWAEAHPLYGPFQQNIDAA